MHVQNRIDLTGKKFGKLTVVEFSRQGKDYALFWKCKCDCGNECEVNGKYLRNGDVKSCGKCYRNEDLTGKKFGALEVISKAPNRGRRVYWKCQCSCGNIVEKRTYDLTSGKAITCGHCGTYKASTMVGRTFGSLTVLEESDGKCKCICSCGNEIVRSTYNLLSGKCFDCGHTNKGFHGEDITGKVYGKLTVVGFDKNRSLWECKCSCGNDKPIYLSKARLKYGDTKSCGCLLHEDKYEDLSNKKYNHLTALNMIGRDRFGKVLWECVCDCGTKIIVPAERLKNGHTKSCGCISVAHIGSEIENQIKDYLYSLSHSLFVKSRILNNKEIDLYNEELKLGIEYNGSIYHATLNGLHENKPKNYHQQKFLLAKEMGIHLINIFDVDYDENKDKILAYLKDIIKPEHRIYARKCNIQVVNKKTAWDFYDKYHLQGKSYMSQINYGLYYNNELMAVIGFGKLRMKNANKEDCYELHRYCVKHDYTIIGGAERLFGYFIKEYSPKYIKSYSDNNYFLGNMYERLGFKYSGQTTISYFWVLKNHKLKREQCQVKKLKELYPIEYHKAIDENVSNKEDDIMTKLGACKIYTAGNSIWEWRV